MSKLRTWPIDPRDGGERELAQRWVMDDYGRAMFARPPENEYQALMECRPHEAPQYSDNDPALTARLYRALESLSPEEYHVWTSDIPLRDLAAELGVGKSTVARMKERVTMKLRKELTDAE